MQVGANAYSPVSRGFLVGGSSGGVPSAAGGGGSQSNAMLMDEETQLQMALAASLAAP